MATDDLFSSISPESPLPVDALRRLSGKGIYLGTSSWKYEGWKGLVYSRPYGSKAAFDRHCLEEYAHLFPTVCGDFAFYQFPRERTLRAMAEQMPPGFTMALKVTEQLTVRQWPRHARYGERAGRANETFLDAEFFARAFLEPARALGEHLGPVILEFGYFPKETFASPDPFLERLDLFLEDIPKGPLYAIEIRNWSWLGPEYFSCLGRHGVAHVFNAWTSMPAIGEQTKMPGSFTANFTVARALLKQGRKYEDAVKGFQPYDAIREELPGLREDLSDMILRCLQEKRKAYVYVNNRAEGNAPLTIADVVRRVREAGMTIVE